MAASDETLHIIDGTALLFSSYYGVREMFSPQKVPVNALFGLSHALLRYMEENGPNYVAVVFDSEGSNFRHELFPDYKANRGEPPEDLIPQFDLALQLVKAMGFGLSSKRGLEADDLIASLATWARKRFDRVVIVSQDKDMCQLISDHCYMYDTRKRTLLDEKAVINRFGVSPKNLVDYQALVGDSVDNIPGVPGVGPKTASALLGTDRHLEDLFSDLESVVEMPVRGAKTLPQKLEAHRDQAFLFRKCVTLLTQEDTGLGLRDLKWKPEWPGELMALFEELGFNRLQERFAQLVSGSSLSAS